MWNVESISDSFTLSVPINADSVFHNDAIAALIQQMLDDFKAKGVPANGSSRLCQYAALFNSSLNHAPSESIQEKLDVALLETLQFETIRRMLHVGPECQSFRRDVAIALSGGFDASEDKPDCKSRSTQFELYLWAWLRLAGFTTTFGEPDLLVQMERENALAIAAKRPRSIKKLVKNLRSGCKQIANSNRDGFVALDLSFIKSLRKPVYVRQAEQHQVVSKIVLDGFVHEHQQEICRSVQSPQVIGVLFHYSSVVRALEVPARLVSRRWLFLQTRGSLLDENCARILRSLQAVGRTHSSVESQSAGNRT